MDGFAMVVDDHSDTCEALQLLLEHEGFEAVCVQTGAEALAKLRDGVPCCLVLLDWWLPDMTAEDFRREQLADPSLADIPVAIVTADARVRGRAAALGIRHVVLKPGTPQEIVDIIADHCPKRADPVASST